MKNRISKVKGSKRERVEDIRTFFLACEFKPHARLFSVFDPFAYDIKPAFIYGSLGIVGYEPESFAIIDTDEKSPPLLGYTMTITEPDTVLLLDKVKGFYGEDTFNTHVRKLVHAYTDVDVVRNAWCYVLSDQVLESFEQVEQVEYGIHGDDEVLLDFLERISE